MNNDDFLVAIFENDDEAIQHYGIKGMRWRKGRKAQEKKKSKRHSISKKRARIKGESIIAKYHRKKLSAANRQQLYEENRLARESKRQSKINQFYTLGKHIKNT